MNQVQCESGFDWLERCADGWQFGEQGILHALALRLRSGIENGYEKFEKRFAEIGAGDGESLPLSCRYLIEDGWSGILCEADPDRYSRLLAWNKSPNVSVCNTPATTENIDTIIGDAAVVTIDVDGLDYRLFAAMQKCPPIVMVEHHDIEDINVDHENEEYVPPDVEIGTRTQSGYIIQACKGIVDKIAAGKGYVSVAHTRVNSIYVHAKWIDTIKGEYRPQYFAEKHEETSVTFPKIEIPSEVIRLNIGAGSVPLPGYTPIDRKLGQEAFPLNYPENSVDEIRASHVLEHLSGTDARRAIDNWYKCLKPGGMIRIAVPDMELAAKLMLEGKDGGKFIGWVYGGQTDRDDFHRTGFNAAGLEHTLSAAGFVCIERWKSTAQDCAALPISLNLQGIKPIHVKRSMCAIMSTPRLIHKHNYLQVMDVMVKRNIPLFDFGGAYWHHGIERLMRAHWDDYEWFVTIDYDTIFNASILDRMSMIFEKRTEFDALAPLQMRRELSQVMSNFEGDFSYNEEAIPAKTAHFGLTFFRTDSLKRFAAHCKAKGKPMLHEGMSPNSQWDDQAIDADMMFWYNFAEAGFKLGITPRVSIGHLENIGVWVGENFEPVYQHVSKFQREGAPLEARR